MLSQRRAATELKARALDTQVELIRSLGGGYVTDVSRADATRTAAAR